MNRREVLTLLGATGAMTNLFGLSSPDQRTETNENRKLSTDFKLKTIGILGGIGPQATMDLEFRIHEVSKRLIAPLYNNGYPPMIVHYHRHAPIMINADLTPVFPLRPDSRLLEAAKRLGAMSDFIIISSNGVHAMQQEIEAGAKCKVVSMIDATLEEVKKRQWKKVGVMGYKNAMVYTNRLKELGIRFEVLTDQQQSKLDASIMRVMEGREDVYDCSSTLDIVNELRSRGTDGIIPGCTELPFLLKENSCASDMVNPIQLLAEAAVKYSMAQWSCEDD